MSFSSDVALQSNQLPISLDVPSPDSPEFLSVISLQFKKMTDTINTKEGSLYLLNENASFKQWYTQGNPQQNRSVYRKVFDLVELNAGPIGAGATVSFPHNINGVIESAMIYAACTSTEPRYFSIMNDTVYLNATTVNFTNPLGVSLTQADVICDYLKQT